MKEISTSQVIEIRKKLLFEFHNLCEKDGIKYSIGYGTLLGAVRHKGMIPWDDDIDVIVSREGFERLNEIYNTNDCRDKYQFLSHKNHPEIKTKIGYFIDFDTITETAYKTNEYHGVHIDVYPVDVVPNGKLEQLTYFFRRRLLHILIRAKDIHPEVVQGRQKAIRKVVLFLCKPFNYDRILDKLQAVSSKYKEMPEKDRKTACISVETGSPLCFPYSITTQYTKYKYDDNQFWGYKDYDSILKAWYGDYMTPPPEQERKMPDHKFVHFYFKDEK